jgi:probable phosphoglycerate mutase
MTRLYLIRHGDYISVDETQNLLCDLGLSPSGIEQAGHLHDRLASTGEIKADVLISSTLLRAQQTAEIIAPALGLPILFDKDVEEWRNDDGEQLSPDEFSARISAISDDQFPFFHITASSETWAQFMLRACTTLNRITQGHAGKNIALICHGGIIEASFIFFFGLSTMHLPSAYVHPHHTSITSWHKPTHEGGLNVWQLETFNDTMHLRNR